MAVIGIIAENAVRSAGEIAEKTGCRTPPIPADIADSSDAGNMIDQIGGQFGRPDIAVDNAGIPIPVKGVQKAAPEDWESRWMSI